MSSSSFEQLTSTTAPGKVFANRSEMAQHYKSDWHKYNLKRRQAGLPVLLEADFQARLQAAQALRAEQAQQQAAAGKDHLKKKKKTKKNKKETSKKNNKKPQPRNQGGDGALASAAHVSSQAAAYDRIKEQKGEDDDDGDTKSMPKEEKEASTQPDPQQQQQLQGEPETRDDEKQPAAAKEETMIEIDPRQCLFDRHYSTTVQANVGRMQRKYGFFVPDQEYLVDMQGLIGYLHEKIKLGLTCLYCQKTGFAQFQDVQRHMISKHHTKLLYEADVDLPDLAVFYDFGAANEAFLGSTKKATSGSDNGDDFEIVSGGNGEEGDDDDDEWDDISDDDEDEMDPKEEEDDDDDDLYDGYQQEVARMGLDVTPLGELIFPDGRIIGHRALRRYYKQQRAAAPSLSNTNNSVSVLAARKAAGERLYRGRVYNIGGGTTATGADAASTSNNALALTKAGIAPGLAAGRAGKGLLVPIPAGSYSQLSIYRYRAAVRKQRRGERQGQRLHQKTNQNINRMDKKHNRLMNGVSVAHAAR